MASSSALLLVPVTWLLCMQCTASQSTTLTVSGPDSTAAPRLQGANVLNVTFTPPVLQVTGEGLGMAACMVDKV